ncbi:hypothetical protein K438DRAFT_1753338 [Mycena galopus ATCC 62051]|nr:hypothetical protein K438DRAFT_1753338 [Mycena galopus ATCC 62051]
MGTRAKNKSPGNELRGCQRSFINILHHRGRDDNGIIIRSGGKRRRDRTRTLRHFPFVPHPTPKQLILPHLSKLDLGCENSDAINYYIRLPSRPPKRFGPWLIVQKTKACILREVLMARRIDFGGDPGSGIIGLVGHPPKLLVGARTVGPNVSQIIQEIQIHHFIHPISVFKGKLQHLKNSSLGKAQKVLTSQIKIQKGSEEVLELDIRGRQYGQPATYKQGVIQGDQGNRHQNYWLALVLLVQMYRKSSRRFKYIISYIQFLFLRWIGEIAAFKE